MAAARFVVVLAAAALALLSGVGAAAYLVAQLSGCYLGWVPLPDSAICAASLWGAAWVPVLVLMASTLLVLTATAAAFRAWHQQFIRARRLRRSLDALTCDTPEGLVWVASEARVRAPVKAVESARPFALTLGVWRPEIYVSTALVNLLDRPGLGAVLSHESAHADGRDPLLLGAVRVAHRLAFMWPVVRALADRAWLDLEVRADRRATSEMGRKTVLTALYSVLSAQSHSDASLAVGSISGLVDDRIAVLAGNPLTTRYSRGAVVLTVFAAGSMLGTILAIVAAALRARGWTV